MPRKALIQIRRGTEAELSGVTLALGELGFTTDTKKLFIGTAAGNVLLVNVSSAGDMLKSIYDTDNDGKVDMAEVADSAPWAGITGKPASFTPSAHTHSGSDVTSKVSAASSADSVPWTGVSGKPSTFPPASHTHSNLLALDTRSVATSPADYDNELKIQFKYLSAIGLSGVASGTYCQLLGYRGWGDDSGGKAHELAFTDGNDIYYRCGNEASGWGAWNRLWHAGNFDPSSKANASHTHAGADITSKVGSASVADSVPWSGVTGTPSTFTPSSHTHAGADITSKVSAASAADSVPWSGVTSKPSTFPPDSHQHGGGDITSAVAQATNADKVDGHHVFVQSSQPTASATGDIWIQI